MGPRKNNGKKEEKQEKKGKVATKKAGKQLSGRTASKDKKNVNSRVVRYAEEKYGEEEFEAANAKQRKLWTNSVRDAATKDYFRDHPLPPTGYAGLSGGGSSGGGAVVGSALAGAILSGGSTSHHLPHWMDQVNPDGVDESDEEEEEDEEEDEGEGEDEALAALWARYQGGRGGNVGAALVGRLREVFAEFANLDPQLVLGEYCAWREGKGSE